MTETAYFLLTVVPQIAAAITFRDNAHTIEVRTAPCTRDQATVHYALLFYLDKTGHADVIDASCRNGCRILPNHLRNASLIATYRRVKKTVAELRQEAALRDDARNAFDREAALAVLDDYWQSNGVAFEADIKMISTPTVKTA